MTDEVQTTQWRNISGHMSDLEGGRQVEAGGFVDLTGEELEANRDRLAAGFVQVEEPVKEPEPFDRKAAMAQAKELGISGYSSLRNDELQTAIIAAQEKKEETD